MYVLGISAFFHDSAACLIKDGQVIAAAQEERFSRIKHDPSFPKEAIKFCLKYASIDIHDVEIIAFYEKPWLKFDRLLKTYLMFAPRGVSSFVEAMPTWLKDKLWLQRNVRKELNFRGKIVFPDHHVSHASGAFFPSPFSNAALITMDGVGEWATASYGVGKSNHLNLIEEMHFPHSLGLLYSAFTYYCGFKVNSGEYKLMCLAPYGVPKFKMQINDN